MARSSEETEHPLTLPVSEKGLKNDAVSRWTGSIQMALPDNTTHIRVVVLGGRRPTSTIQPKSHLNVSKRLLDPVPWSVTAYDPKTGECTLTRGIHRFVDHIFNSASSLRLAAWIRRDCIRGRALCSGKSPIDSNEKYFVASENKCDWSETIGFKNGGILTWFSRPLKATVEASALSCRFGHPLHFGSSVRSLTRQSTMLR